MDSTATRQLLGRMQELRDLQGVIHLATWDQEVYLPPKGADARAVQLATLQGVYHERLVAEPLGELLERALSDAGVDPDLRAMARVLRRERDRAVNVPDRLVRALAEAQSQGLVGWRQAREENDFSLFKPALEKILALRREEADAIGHGGERYDALLDAYEPELTVERLTPVLTALRDKLTPIVHKLCRPPVKAPPDVVAGKRYDVERQWRFTLKLLEDMGFDFEAGRQDRSIHPFTGGTHPRDVRLTTRLFEDSPLPGFFASIHEGGHGLYEQGFAEAHHRTSLAAAPSMGLHESQSRLWEDQVGRSLAFWRHYFPKLQAEFPEALGDVSVDAFHASLNRVSPSLIRVDADEVTYNLHIVLRYELELLLLQGELPLEDLPAEWNARMDALLGVRPPDDIKGVLQDIHWAWGEFGYFPSYTLGNLYAAMLFNAAKQALPELDSLLSRGQLIPLRDWLRAHIHAQGSRYPTEELIRRVTGKGLTDEDFISYLKGKYAAIYGVML